MRTGGSVLSWPVCEPPVGVAAGLAEHLPMVWIRVLSSIVLENRGNALKVTQDPSDLGGTQGTSPRQGAAFVWLCPPPVSPRTCHRQ